MARTTIRRVRSPARHRRSIPKDAAVLVVEDNVSNFVLVARMLGYLGIHCEWKTSGYEVLEYADALPRVDLVLMDIRLPYEDGFGAGISCVNRRASSRCPSWQSPRKAAESKWRRPARPASMASLASRLDPDKFPDQIRRILNGEQVWELG